MRIRGKETYISSEIWKCCHLIAKSRGTITDDQGLGRVATADEIADDILRRAIKAEYPATLEYLKQVSKLEAETIKQLGGGKGVA